MIFWPGSVCRWSAKKQNQPCTGALPFHQNFRTPLDWCAILHLFIIIWGKQGGIGLEQGNAIAIDSTVNIGRTNSPVIVLETPLLIQNRICFIEVSIAHTTQSLHHTLTLSLALISLQVERKNMRYLGGRWEKWYNNKPLTRTYQSVSDQRFSPTLHHKFCMCQCHCRI